MKEFVVKTKSMKAFMVNHMGLDFQEIQGRYAEVGNTFYVLKDKGIDAGDIVIFASDSCVAGQKMIPVVVTTKYVVRPYDDVHNECVILNEKTEVELNKAIKDEANYQG